MRLFKERALPDLGSNIKCGNSLIGPDFYQGKQMSLLDSEEAYRINAFDWEKEFPEIMKRGGFDTVIGNPPYIRIQTMKEWAPIEVEIYKKYYTSASKGNYDIYVVFVERGLSLLNKSGRMGFILSHKFFNAQYGESLRALLAKGRHLADVVHFGDQQVFIGATNYTCLLFLDKAGSKQCHFVKVDDLASWRIGGESREGKIPATKITSSEWNFTVGKSAALFEKFAKMPMKLGNIADIFVGTQTSADTIFVLDNCRFERNYVVGLSRSLAKEVRVEAGCVKLFLQGKEIRRYEPLQSSAFLICPYEISENRSRLFTVSEMASRFPLTLKYLEANKEALVVREKGRFKGQDWYAFGYPKSMTLFQKPKIVVPDYNNVPSFTFDSNGHFYKTGYGVIVNESLSAHYVLGLLNSPLLFQYLVSIGTSLRGGYVRFWTQFLKQLPIKTINFSDPTDKSRHDKIVELVERMLSLHKQLATAKTPDEKTRIQRLTDATDQQIDRLVYELYALTEEEIEIVEAGVK
jgi:hypothetical protein